MTQVLSTGGPVEDASGEVPVELTIFRNRECDRGGLRIKPPFARAQHRGGPAGFLKVLDSKTLAFADFVGNRQYITTGNLAENDRAFLFLMNYAEHERVKIWGRAHIVTDDANLFGQLADPNYDARIEQAIVFRVVDWDINCPQHIPRLVHAEGMKQTIAALQQRVRYLV